MFNFVNVSKSYPERGALNGNLAISNITFEVRDGEFLCLIGPSGCGKSTLLNMMAGFDRPSSGDARFRGAPIEKPGPDRTVIFQDYGLYPWMTVAENIGFGLSAKSVAKLERRQTIARLVEFVRLSGFEDRFPDELSGGMRQRVSLARALAPDPSVVLMDEPFAALDSITRDALQEELLRIWAVSHQTFVLITHNIEEAVFLADRVLVMSGRPGRVDTVVDVDLPRPRTNAVRVDSRFVALKEEISRRLRIGVLAQNGERF
ncbi:ABC transporter ATP-binding protein [Methylobacterium sp. E-045]|uniref:ABC transporter ATP-binding protein n=1 Tax=Methylobacterium sp. E-045 TaxID=2836575 RepID=UPI001FBBD7DA|nr:ABC transporter ATP-binding protein [Methylobacterium sp. E-045]MCJ2128153.1 ABC transporter ATP-binding protein [Methylobacterium sp. E-045]